MSVSYSLKKMMWQFQTEKVHLPRPEQSTFKITQGHDSKIMVQFTHIFGAFSIIEHLECHAFNANIRSANVTIVRHNQHRELTKEEYLSAEKFRRERIHIFEKMQQMNAFHMDQESYGCMIKSHAMPLATPRPLHDFCTMYQQLSTKHLVQQERSLFDPRVTSLFDIVCPDYKGVIHQAIYGHGMSR